MKSTAVQSQQMAFTQSPLLSNNPKILSRNWDFSFYLFYLSQSFANEQRAVLAYVTVEYFNKKTLFYKLSGLVHSSIVPTSLVSTLVRVLNMDIYEHG